MQLIAILTRLIYQPKMVQRTVTVLTKNTKLVARRQESRLTLHKLQILLFLCLAGLTKCQKMRHTALAWTGQPPPGRFVPQCDKTGRYEPVQCQGSYCWCVDENGREIPRTHIKGKTDCGVPGT